MSQDPFTGRLHERTQRMYAGFGCQFLLWLVGATVVAILFWRGR